MSLNFGNDLFKNSLFQQSAEDGQGLIFAGSRYIYEDLGYILKEDFKNLARWETLSSGAGSSVSVSGNICTLNAGTTVGGYAGIKLKQSLKTIGQRGIIIIEYDISYTYPNADHIETNVGFSQNCAISYPPANTSNNIMLTQNTLGGVAYNFQVIAGGSGSGSGVSTGFPATTIWEDHTFKAKKNFGSTLYINTTPTTDSIQTSPETTDLYFFFYVGHIIGSAGTSINMKIKNLRISYQKI